MSRTALMILMYCVIGGLVSAGLAAKTHLGMCFQILLLPLIYLAYLGWSLLHGKSSDAGSRVCLTCSKSISRFRRLSDHRFCCEEHQRQWFDELEELAIERLKVARNDYSAVNLPRKPAAPKEATSSSGDLALVLANR
jgi:hypothetical protein